jgi:hypothetical protein
MQDSTLVLPVAVGFSITKAKEPPTYLRSTIATCLRARLVQPWAIFCQERSTPKKIFAVSYMQSAVCQECSSSSADSVRDLDMAPWSGDMHK